MLTKNLKETLKKKAEEHEISSDEDSEDRRRRKRKEKKEARKQAELRAKQQKAEEENNLPDPSVLVQVFNPFRFMHWDIPTVDQYKEETKAFEPQQRPANSLRTFVSTSQKKPTLKSKADSNRTTSGLRQSNQPGTSVSKKEPDTPGKSVKNDSKYTSKRTLGNPNPEDDLKEPSKHLSSKQEPGPKIASVRAMPDQYEGDILDEQIRNSAKQIPRKQTALKMGSPIGYQRGVTKHY